MPGSQFCGIPVNSAVVRVHNQCDGIHASGSPRVRGDRGSGRILVHPNGLALNALAQLVLGIRARRSEPRRQTVEFRCVGQGRLQRVVEAPSETWQIDRRRIPAVNTNALALVRQLAFVARRTGYAGIVAGWPAFDRGRNRRFADANRQPIRIVRVRRVQGAGRSSRSDRSRSWLPATSRFK